MMQALYKDRLARHQKKMIRYLKYVLNDHVVLVSVFLLGGFGFYYSSFVKQLNGPLIGWRFLIGVLWLMVLYVGKCATLVEEADKVFLLPKERQLSIFLKQALKHSIGLPFFLEFLLVGIAMPILIASTRASIFDFLINTLVLWGLKSSHLLWQVQSFYQKSGTVARRVSVERVSQWGLAILAVFSSLFFSTWSGLIFVGIGLVYSVKRTKQVFDTATLDWEVMISTEKNRLQRIYKFFNLFTDVPGIAGQVHRRKLLDKLLKAIPTDQAHTYLYLYSRSFLRGSEYSGLYLRLTIIGGLLVVFIQEFWLTLALAFVIIYLLGFQLLPLYSQFDYMLMTRLYPIDGKQKAKAVQQLLRVLLIVAGGVFILLSCFSFATLQQIGIFAVTIGIEVIVFTSWYAPSRLNKMSKR